METYIEHFKLIQMSYNNQKLSKKEYYEKLVNIFLEIIKHCTSLFRDITFSDKRVLYKFDDEQIEANEYIQNSKDVDNYPYICHLVHIFTKYFKQQGVLEDIDDMMKELTFTRPVETKTKNIFVKSRN